MEQTQQQMENIKFDAMQSQALKEAEQAKATSQILIEQLNARAVDLEQIVYKKEEKLFLLKLKVSELKQKAKAVKEESEKSYTETLNLVIGSFGTKPPWTVRLQYEKGRPTGADILKSK